MRWKQNFIVFELWIDNEFYPSIKCTKRVKGYISTCSAVFVPNGGNVDMLCIVSRKFILTASSVTYTDPLDATVSGA